MDAERKMYINEDHLLNSPGATKIYLNAGKRKVNSPNDGTVIHLNTDKQADLGVYLNTTSTIESSKKIRLLFFLNFLLSLASMVICFTVAGYYWHELSGLQRQMDVMKEHLLIQDLNQAKLMQRSLVGLPTPQAQAREPQTEKQEPSENSKNILEDLGDELLLDTKKKNYSNAKHTTTYTTIQKDLLIAQFNGAINEINMGEQYYIGPWIRDEEISSKNSNDKIVLSQEKDAILIKESGLYLIYAQVAYLTHSPNMYNIWAKQNGAGVAGLRLLSMCATGDDSTRRTLDRAQITCAVQTAARLHAGDTISISQRDANRTLTLKPGHSYIGFVKLSH